MENLKQYGPTNPRRVKGNEEIQYIVEDAEHAPVLYTIVGEFTEKEYELGVKYKELQEEITGIPHIIREV